jgi:hypothetical protein
MLDLSRELELGKVNLTAFGCLLSFELTDTWPELSRRIAAFTNRELRLLRERMPGLPYPVFTAAEMRAVMKARGPLPLTGRFVRPARRHLVASLREDCPKLARKIARLSDGGFEWLCGQLQGRRGADD